ncbi:hypothetical protein QR721_04405 [Aciduricibacillus chroicocephali]|uniref:YitT family protein n=1 Tax=Aciduricibacillus chroicocephali TaxID=3054939 RepID=A0ABY9L0X0_9BACI|nr:hypothetical protein QR721_04405 [Bacillaceae bacterium 44XB]
MLLAKRLGFFMLGLILFSLGIAQAVQIQYLGIHPWEVLHVGLYEKFGLSIGTWSIIIGIGLIFITLILDRRYINIGTFLNVFLVGWAVDLWLWLNFLPKGGNLIVDVVIMLCSMALMGVGGGMNNAARIGSGPRDGFMLSISDKTGISIRKVRITMETSVFVLGIMIGGPVFLFTFLYTFVQSPIFQFAYERTTVWLIKDNYEEASAV